MGHSWTRPNLCGVHHTISNRFLYDEQVNAWVFSIDSTWDQVSHSVWLLDPSEHNWSGRLALLSAYRQQHKVYVLAPGIMAGLETSASYSKTGNILDWLGANTTDKWFIEIAAPNYHPVALKVTFKNADDAIRFKLTWPDPLDADLQAAINAYEKE